MYEGYRIKIGDVVIPDTLISQGTYEFVNERRQIRSWQDANGIFHNDYFQRLQASITFSIRERSLEDHESIKGIFSKMENVAVTYWDDYDCEYKTGTFEMKKPKIKHRFAPNGTLFYEATQIALGEY